jgi:hypothetical protein
MTSTVRFISFPRTDAPPSFVPSIVDVFRRHESQVGTEVLGSHLKSDYVLRIVATDLQSLGFAVESGKNPSGKLGRPVFFGENGDPTLRYEVDAFHPEWRCGLEVEGIRAMRGGALYRDLIQAMVMVQVDHLCIAVPNIVTWGAKGKSRSYREAVRTADALYGHTRVHIPYGLTLIGY